MRGDRARLAQALGNVLSNAAEHGTGDVDVEATRESDRLRIEVTNATRAARATTGHGGRGRGLEIAADAAADSGGNLSAAVGKRRASAVLDLPLEL